MKKVTLIVLLICCVFNSKAQLLWEISGNDLQKPSYLYGTMHIGDKRVYDFNDSLLLLFDQCDIFAGELVLEQSLFRSLNLLMGMRMQGDTTLADLLSKDQYAFIKGKLDKKLDEMGMLFSAGFIEKMKPIFISIIMSDLDIQSGSNQIPLDLHFQNIAKEKNMEVIGLETIDEQMAVFDRIPLKKQADMLYHELKKQEEDDDAMDMDKLIDIYASEDLDSLYKLTQGSFDNDMNAELLYKRNVKYG